MLGRVGRAKCGLSIVCSVRGCDKPIRSLGLCGAHYVRHNRSQNPERARAHQAAYRLRNYNLTQGQFDAIFEGQGRRCAICKSKRPRAGNWHIDHDHNCCPEKGRSCGKCIRGILCGPCNHLLGNAEDKTEVLRAAADYIDRYACTKVSEALEALFADRLAA